MALRAETLVAVQVALHIRNEDIVFDTDITDTIAQRAINEISRTSPADRRKDYVGNGEHRRELPSNWIDEFSVVRKVFDLKIGQGRGDFDENDYHIVEVDATERSLDNVSATDTSITTSTAADAQYIQDGDVILIRNDSQEDSEGETNWASADGNGTTGVITLKNAMANTFDSTPIVKKVDHINFTGFVPGTNDRFSVMFTGKHVHTDATDTIPDNDYNAFVSLIASYVAYEIAAAKSDHTAPTIDADAVDYPGEPQHWLDLADRYMKEYKDHFGIGRDPDKKVRPHVTMVDLDLRYRTGHRRLWETRYR